MARCVVLLGLYLSVLAVPSQAHFLVLHAEQMQLPKPKRVSLAMPFGHPSESAEAMPYQWQDFFVVHRGNKKSLTSKLNQRDWRPKGLAWRADYVPKGMGDHVLVLTQAPFYEVTEDIYIQQFCKTILNVANLPTDWDQPVGLSAEIQPLNTPYGVPTGSNFRGLVLGDGKPVPFAEIEVIYLNHPPVTHTDASQITGAVSFSRSSHETLLLRSGPDGSFSVTLPKAGYWGIAALGVGPVTEHEGKPLSQDAVIWVQVEDL